MDKCKDEIKSACTFSIDDSALAVLLQCGVDAKAFFDAVDKCFTNSTTDAEGCSCFDALDKDSKMYDKVVACKTKDANVAVLKEKKNCKKSGYQCIKILNYIIINNTFYCQSSLRVRLPRTTLWPWLTAARSRPSVEGRPQRRRRRSC